MLFYSFDRFYVVIKFIFPMINDLKFSTIKCDEKCKYLQEKGCTWQSQRPYIRSYHILEKN